LQNDGHWIVQKEFKLKLKTIKIKDYAFNLRKEHQIAGSV